MISLLDFAGKYIEVYQPMFDEFGIRIEFEACEEGVFVELNSENWGHGCATLKTENGIVNFLDRHLLKLRREAIGSY